MTTQLQLYRDAARLIGDHTVDSLSEDNPLRYALDEAYVGGPTFVLRQAAWRFALVTETIAGNVTGIPGFTLRFERPANWLRTHSIFKLSGSKECPIDAREQTIAYWYANITPLTFRYVSSLYATQLGVWPEHFTRAVAAYLAFDIVDKISGDPARKSQMWDLFQQFLQNAMAHDALSEDPWLNHQLDGSFLSAARNMLTQGFWNFALRTEAPAESGSSITGFTTSFVKPDGWMRTHSVFKLDGSKELPVDCREEGNYWFANEPIRVRYVSSSYIDSSTWPEEFMRVVAAYLGIDWGDGNARAVTPDGQGGQKVVLWPQYLKQALDNISILPSQWLTFQLDGSFAHAVDKMLESGLWKHAIDTVVLDSISDDASPSYAYAFNKPEDWIRTDHVYEQIGSPDSFPTVDCDIDFRDEGGMLHANVTPIVLRYLSFTSGRAPENWSNDFTEAVLAYLNYQRAVANPQTSGAGLQAKLAAYKEAEKNARIRDEMRERPKMFTVGMLRRSRGGRSNYDREQGWRW